MQKKKHRQTRDLLCRNSSKNDIFVKFIEIFLHKIDPDLFNLFVIQCNILCWRLEIDVQFLKKKKNERKIME